METRGRAIQGPLVDVLRYVNADVVSFNEFVDSPTNRIPNTVTS